MQRSCACPETQAVPPFALLRNPLNNQAQVKGTNERVLYRCWPKMLEIGPVENSWTMDVHIGTFVTYISIGSSDDHLMYLCMLNDFVGSLVDSNTAQTLTLADRLVVEIHCSLSTFDNNSGSYRYRSSASRYILKMALYIGSIKGHMRSIQKATKSHPLAPNPSSFTTTTTISSPSREIPNSLRQVRHNLIPLRPPHRLSQSNSHNHNFLNLPIT